MSPRDVAQAFAAPCREGRFEEAGERSWANGIGVWTVRDGRIVEESFFHD